MTKENGTQPLLTEFGQKLKDLRRNKTVAEIAGATNGKISASSLGHWESGRIVDPDPAVLPALASAYGVDPLVLVSELVREKYLQPLIASETEHIDLISAAFQAPKPLNGLAVVARDVLRAKTSMLGIDIIDVPGVAAMTERLKPLDECWVVAADLADDENEALLSAIINRLNGKNPPRFFYFIRDEQRKEFWYFKYKLLSPKLNKQSHNQIEKLVKGWPLNKFAAAWMHADFSVFKQGLIPEIGFQWRRQNRKPQLGVRMSEADLRDLTSELGTLMLRESPIAKPTEAKE